MRFSIGQIVQAGSDRWHDMMGKTGRLYRVDRVTHHADGICFWVNPWMRDTRRVLKSGRTEGARAGFSHGVLEPIGDGSGYVAHPDPLPGYAGEPLPLIQEREETIGSIAA